MTPDEMITMRGMTIFSLICMFRRFSFDFIPLYYVAEFGACLLMNLARKFKAGYSTIVKGSVQNADCSTGPSPL